MSINLINWHTRRDGPATRLLVKIKKQISPLSAIQTISESGVLFVHIPKNAGTSMAQTIYNLAKYPGHYKWWFYKGYFGTSKYEALFKFSVVRNPYDRLVSAYEYLRAGGNSPTDKAFSDKFIIPCQDFETFVAKLADTKEMRHWVHFLPQHEFIYDNARRLMVNHVIRFENLQEETEQLCARLGISSPLRHAKKSIRKDYSTYYSPALRDTAGRLYQTDFELLGYER